MRTWLILPICSALVLTACGNSGPDEVEVVLQNVLYDVGGSVLDEAGDQALEGATVTINGIDAFEATATTDAYGLWTILDLEPGVYVVTYELATYETQTRPFSLEAGGQNDVANSFVSLGTIRLTGPGAIASVSAPFSIDVQNGDNFIDGQNGMTLVYTLSADGDIVVTFDTPVFGGEVRLDDLATGDNLVATPDNTNQIFTLLRTDMDQMDNGNGLASDMDPNTRDRLRLQGFSYNQGNNQRNFNADLRFNCVP